MENAVSERTLKRLERAAMRWYRSVGKRVSLSKPNIYSGWQTAFFTPHQPTLALHRACAAHAQRKGAKRKGRGRGRG